MKRWTGEYFSNKSFIDYLYGADEERQTDRAIDVPVCKMTILRTITTDFKVTQQDPLEHLTDIEKRLTSAEIVIQTVTDCT